ncbi:MAG: Excinuclease ABC, C subunit domain protein [Parcubacteria bacterium 33_209]|nr:MAG: Excinuclease ABC, C subunit domain protein [Parcubacteria bacterium 33_209]
MKNWREKIDQIPKTSGIYLFYQKGKLVYVGKATSLRDRVRSYLSPKTTRPIEVLINSIDEVKWRQANSIIEAIILEANYIKEFKPKYNVKEKDDKSWNYLAITKDDFPKLLAVRERNLKAKDYKYVFGPYAEGKISEVLRILHSLFLISRCSPNQKKPCFDYNLKRCLGVCTNEITIEDYNKKVIKPLVLFLKGKKKSLINSLERQMKQYSKSNQFEEAIRIRNQIKSLQKIVDFSLLDKSFIEDNKISFSKRIEGYDVSNLGDEVMVGSMVVFENGKAVKKEYKKFKIKNVKNQSDTDCIKEVIERRFNHKEWKSPDLILIDGGKPQVSAVKKIVEGIPVIGIAKGKDRKKDELIGEDINYDKDLLLKVRDEAHRFAINYQRQIKRKKLTS